jgi:hypothetical protein
MLQLSVCTESCKAIQITSVIVEPDRQLQHCAELYSLLLKKRGYTGILVSDVTAHCVCGGMANI